MASKKIQGITIAIDGETSGLGKALSGVNKQANSLGGELREVDKLLKFNPGNADLAAQKQRLLSEQVEVTSDKLRKLNEAHSQVKAQLDSGNIGEDQYRAFQREIVKTESQLDLFRQKLQAVDNGDPLAKVGQDLKGVREEANKAESSVGELGAALGGLAAGATGAGAIQQALDMSTLDTNIEISMEVPEESKSAVRDAIKTVEAYGLDATEALEGTRRQWALNADATDEMNAKAVESAGVISRAFSGVDFTELIQESNEISKTFGVSNQEALGLVNSLLKAGFPPEQLDIIAEYGEQLGRAGYNAQEIQAIMASAAETGTFNIDVLLDGLKEGRILLSEFGAGIDDTTASLLEGTDISATQLQAWGQAIAAGGEAGKVAMQQVAEALLGVDDATTQNQLGVAFFGTMWEENGTKITDTLLGMNDNLMTTKENTDGVKDSVATVNADPMVQLKDAVNEMQIALQPLLEWIASVVSIIATWMAENPKLASTVIAIVAALGTLSGIIMLLTPVITAISGMFGGFSVVMGALTGPVGLVIAAITALALIAGVIIKNWGPISGFFSDLWSSVTEKFTSSLDTIGSIFSGTFGFLKELVTGDMSTITDLFGAGLDFIDSKTDGAFISVTDTIRSYLEMASGIVDSSMDYVQSSFENALDFILGLITGDFEGMSDAVLAQMENIQGHIEDVWGSVMDFLDGIDLFDTGKNMIDGLIEGIVDKGSDLVGSVKKVLGNAITGGEDELEINSPSKVFRGMGVYSGEGYEDGLRSMGRRIEKASRAMMTNALVEPDVGLNAAGTSGNSNSSNLGGGNSDNGVHIHIGSMTVTSQDDIVEISRQLKALLDRDKRGKGGGL